MSTSHGDSRDVEDLSAEERIALLHGVQMVLEHHGITCLNCQAMLLLTIGTSVAEAVSIIEGVGEIKH